MFENPLRFASATLFRIVFWYLDLREEQQDTLGADYKTNSHISKKLEITPVVDKLLE